MWIVLISYLKLKIELGKQNIWIQHQIVWNRPFTDFSSNLPTGLFWTFVSPPSIMLGELCTQVQHLLDPYQFACRDGRSTADALSTTSDLILKLVEKTPRHSPDYFLWILVPLFEARVCLKHGYEMLTFNACWKYTDFVLFMPRSNWRDFYWWIYVFLYDCAFMTLWLIDRMTYWLYMLVVGGWLTTDSLKTMSYVFFETHQGGYHSIQGERDRFSSHSLGSFPK